MDRSEAKFLLQACRPNGADTSDPRFAEALALLQQDPELKAWFDSQQAFDAAVSEKLRNCPVPSDLRTSIIAARKVVPAPPWWKHPVKMISTLAAMLTLLAIPFILQTGSSTPRFAEFKADGMAFLDSLNRLDMTSKDHEAVREWLAVHGGHRQFSVPGKLGTKPSLGCRVFEWNGNTVTLICFNTTVKNQFEEVHLLVVDEKAIRGWPPEGEPVFEEQGVWSTASWRDKGLTYVLFGHTKNRLKLEQLF